ncbi:MAG: response regulator [Fimbriimonadaceae bacterium]|nr:response regulator [Fimbriimonadaceae bacterium]
MSIAVKILVVDDEAQIRKFLKSSFAGTEYKVIEAEDGQTALRLAGTEMPDVILLDLGLPDIDGVEVAKQIREWSQVPIIVLTARGHEDDKVEALDAGADDYLTKPFSVKELMARVKVMLRRTLGSAAAEPVVEFGDCKLDLAARLVYKKDEVLKLTPIEYKLLAFMAKYADKVVTHKMLLSDVWGPGYDFEVQYLRVHMKNLRHKIEDEPANPQFILTEAGVGYRLVTKG